VTLGLGLALGATGLSCAWALSLRRRLRAARAAAARFRGLIEAADDIIFRTDAEGCFTYTNPAALEQLGYSEEDLLGRSFLEVVREDYREQASPNSYCEFPMVTRAGEELWVGQRVQIVTEDGRFAGLQGLARDVTERNRIEQALEREREQLRQIVTHAPVAMAMLDRDGRHVAHSARWLRYLAVADPSVVGRTVDEIWPGMPERYRQSL
jgi:PAS domain S-box-containing protein